MAYYNLQPFGDHIADLRHGTACALLANVNRNPDAKPDPYEPKEFIYWTADSAPVDQPPVELADPVDQSNLLRAALFGIAPKKPDQPT